MKANAFARAIPSRPGRVAAIEAKIDGEIVQVRAKMNGVVERVLVAKGQLVEKDDLLVELDHCELNRRIAAAAAALDLALANSRARARKSPQAARNPGGVSASAELPASIEVHRARAAYMKARVNRLETEIRAPVAGRVLGRRVLAGGYVGVSEPLVSILEGTRYGCWRASRRRSLPIYASGSTPWCARAGTFYLPASRASLPSRTRYCSSLLDNGLISPCGREWRRTSS